MELLRRFFLAVMAGVFVSWAYFQLNDPDALPWVLLYALTAVGTGLAIIRRLHVALPLVLAAFAGVWALIIAWQIATTAGFGPVFSGFLEDVGESGRELLGLAIAAGWNGVLVWMARG